MKIQGLEFFDKAPSCISNFEKAHWSTKALSLIQSFANLVPCLLYKIGLILRKVEAQMTPYTAIPSQLFTQKLVVCIHGLNSNPSQYKPIVDEMQAYELSKTQIYIPRVFQKGNAKLDELVKPIFEEINKWSQSNGDKTLVLVGISNGGRIARAIEAQLNESNKGNIKHLKFISIVGACQGSTLANLAHRLHLSWLTTKNIAEEMPVNSTRNERLNRDWEEGLKNSSSLTRDYTFIASPHDWQVTNYSSSLIEVNNHRAKYCIIPGHGHNSIVNAAAKAVAQLVCQ